MKSPLPYKINKNNFYVLTGNFLEYFDLYMYVHLAYVIQKHFFVEAHTPLLNTFTFANLYLFGPIGCIIFAYLGDTFGRKKVIVSTSLIMAFCSSAIGFLPTYNDVGALAGVMLIALRILQGISLSGEPVAAMLYLIESVPYRYAPLVVAVGSSTVCLGGAIALGIGYLAIQFWGEEAWRVPFYLGSFFCFFSLWMRWNLAESKEFLEYTSEHKAFFAQQKQESILNFYRSLEFKQRNFFCWIAMVCVYSVAFGISYIYLGKYLLSHAGLTEQELLAHNFKVSLCEMAVCLVEGLMVVYFSLNVKKYIFLRTLIFLCILPFIIRLFAFSPSVAAIFIVQVAFVTLSDHSVVAASLTKTFPVIGRYSLTGMGWAYAKFLNFFISGVVLNFISIAYPIVWIVALMLPFAFIFLVSIVFYTPYEQAIAFSPEADALEGAVQRREAA